MFDQEKFSFSLFLKILNTNFNSFQDDSNLTSVIGKKMGKISAWYDNEWGFSNRMCDIVEYLDKIS